MNDANTVLEDVSFNIIFSADWWRNPAKVKIWLNDEFIQSAIITKKTENNETQNVSFSRGLPEGEHKLIIEYYDKDNSETVQDENDPTIILKDQLLKIEDIEIDDISLGYLVCSQSSFYPDRLIHSQLPEEMKEIVVTGYNGKLELKFQVPTYIWFLENL